MAKPSTLDPVVPATVVCCGCYAVLGYRDDTAEALLLRSALGVVFPAIVNPFLLINLASVGESFENCMA